VRKIATITQTACQKHLSRGVAPETGRKNGGAYPAVGAGGSAAQQVCIGAITSLNAAASGLVRTAAVWVEFQQLLQQPGAVGAEGAGVALLLALLGTLPDGEVAALTGRSVTGVRVRRTKLGLPTARDGRRR
jgi:hypothetical protein